MSDPRDEITKGFKPFAVNDDRLGLVVTSYNPETKEYLICVSGKLLGPFKRAELKALVTHTADMLTIPGGMYTYLSSYDVYGELK